MRRFRRALPVLLAAAALCMSFVTVAPAASGGRALALLDIDRIGPDRLEAIKAHRAVEWWVEVDREILVAGKESALERAFSSRRGFRLLGAAPSESELYFLKRYQREEIEAAGATVLVTDGTASVVRATRAQIEALGHAHEATPGAEEGCRGHSSVSPFAPNTLLAHQAVNGRIPAAKFDVAIQGLVDQVSGSRWFADDQSLAGFNRWTRGSGIASAREWLVSQFSALPGLEVSTQAFNVPGSPSVTAYNVIAKLPGTTNPDDWYIVGAHYDAISNDNGHATAPGAEDNGSGTAGVLELARIFTANRPDATVYFICYAGEEQGLYGSAAHAQSLVASGDSAKVKAMFNLDMIGYTGDADLDCLLETRSIGQSLMSALSANATQYTTLRIVTSMNPCCSDHMPYIDRGMPAILAIENDYGSYAGYHRSTDLPGNLNVTMASEILKMYVATIAQMTGTAAAGLGDETVGVYNPATGTFFVRNTNTPGAADAAFQYGAGGLGWRPLSGDWNGDGSDSAGVYDPATSTFFLRNANSPGPADLTVSFGTGGAGLVPLAGDWDGDGDDTVGLYNPASGAFFLRGSNTPGPADLTFFYGGPGATPLAGDWDGDGIDTIGIYVPSSGAFFLRNSNSGGAADMTFFYGPPNSTWVPVVGDWNNDNAHTVGLYDPAVGAFFLRNSNSAGPGNTVVFFGPAPGFVPVAGDWNGQ